MREETQKGKAFIGISLDSELFTKSWVREAFDVVSTKHKSSLVLLADDLLRYTRTVRPINGKLSFVMRKSSEHIRKRTDELKRFLQKELERLPEEKKACISIRQWGDYSDRAFVDILRNLHIAYERIEDFRSAVEEVAEAHVQAINGSKVQLVTVGLNILFIIEEVAMCLRVTEIGGYYFEYYPTAEISVLRRLYSGEFRRAGLTVENLIDMPAKRIFRVL